MGTTDLQMICKGSPKETKVHSLDRQYFPGDSTEAKMLEVEGNRSALLESQVCVMAPGYWVPLHINCVLREARISWGSLQMARPQGSRSRELCSLDKM